MSQDIRREREGAFVPWTDVKAAKSAERWKNIAYNENERAGQIQQLLDAANAKLAEADDALDQARRDASVDPRVQGVLDWLDRKEATVRDRVNFAIGPADGFSDLGAIESRAAKLRHGQYDSKLLSELRRLLAPSELQAARYWRCDCRYVYRLRPGYDLESAGRDETRWTPSVFRSFEAMAAGVCPVREITAAELPEGVTP